MASLKKPTARIKEQSICKKLSTKEKGANANIGGGESFSQD